MKAIPFLILSLLLGSPNAQATSMIETLPLCKAVSDEIYKKWKSDLHVAQQELFNSAFPHAKAGSLEYANFSRTSKGLIEAQNQRLADLYSDYQERCASYNAGKTTAVSKPTGFDYTDAQKAETQASSFFEEQYKDLNWFFKSEAKTHATYYQKFVVNPKEIPWARYHQKELAKIYPKMEFKKLDSRSKNAGASVVWTSKEADRNTVFGNVLTYLHDSVAFTETGRNTGMATAQSAGAAKASMNSLTPKKGGRYKIQDTGVKDEAYIKNLYGSDPTEGQMERYQEYEIWLAEQDCLSSSPRARIVRDDKGHAHCQY